MGEDGCVTVDKSFFYLLYFIFYQKQLAIIMLKFSIIKCTELTTFSATYERLSKFFLKMLQYELSEFYENLSVLRSMIPYSYIN